MIDFHKLQIGKKLYADGYYEESMKCIEKLMEKYKYYTVYDSFFIDLIFSYNTICTFFNKTHEFTKAKKIIDNIDNIDISDAQKDHCKEQYVKLCLGLKNTN